MKHATFITLPLMALALSVGQAHAQAQSEDTVLVIAGLAPVAALLEPLVADTGIETALLTPRPAPLATMSAMLARPDPERPQLIAEADAIVTIGHAWPLDPTYMTARAENIRIVEIDATAPLDGFRPAVPRIAAPVSRPDWRDGGMAEPVLDASHYPWLGPSAAIAMAEILAHDLARLAPDQAVTIEANLDDFRTDIRRLKAEYDQKFAGLADFTVYALSDQFTYLTNEFGIFVDGYFLEQDVRWTEQDFAGLAAHLQDRNIAAVLHQWTPAEPIVAVVEEAGADLVVLSSGETMDFNEPDSYLELMRANLDALYAALSER